MTNLSERETQTLTVATLRKIGFLVCVTSNRKRTSNTKGTPDLFVHIKDHLWLAMEIKGTGGKLSKEQAFLKDVGTSIVITDVEDAVQTCLALRREK